MSSGHSVTVTAFKLVHEVNITDTGGLASVGQNAQSVIARKRLSVRWVASFSEEVLLVNVSYNQP